MQQKDFKIELPKAWVTNVVDGTSSISSMDMLVYVTMRSYARGSTNVGFAQYACGDNPIEWVCELRADMMNPKVLRDILYDVSKKTRSERLLTIKQSISVLIDNNMVVCYNEVEDKSYSGSEFMELCDKWNSDDIVYYFPVPADFFFVPADDVLKMIKYCKKNKELSVDYYMMLYLMVRFNFSISKIPERCYMRAPRASYFTGRRYLWDKAAKILKESVGIYCVCRRGTNEDGSIGTWQNFFESEVAYQNFLNNKDNMNGKFDDGDDSYFGDVVDIAEYEEDCPLPWEKEEKKVTVVSNNVGYSNHPFVMQYETKMDRLLAESCINGYGFPPKTYLTLEEKQQRERIKNDWELWQQKEQEI